MNKKILLYLFIVIVVTLSGCGINNNELFDQDKVITSENLVNDYSDNYYVPQIENSKYILSFNNSTTAISITDKSDGYTWYSVKQSSKPDGTESSPFSLTYLTYDGKVKIIDSVDFSIKKNQFKYSKKDNCLKVSYSLGDFTEMLKVPYAITEERFQKLSDSIEDDFEKEKFSNMYSKVSLSNLQGANRTNYLKNYPLLEKMDMYILKDRIKNYPEQMKILATLLKNIGYSNEMYEEDAKNCNSEISNVDKDTLPYFNIEIDYCLSDKGLTVTVPNDSIQMNSKCPLISIQLLKYFGSPENGDEGYYLLPDGTGSLMKFFNGKADLQEYSVSIYGDDFGMNNSERIYNFKNAYLPIFAVKNGNHGMLAFVKSGDGIADIKACPGNDKISSYAYADFKIRNYYKSQKSSSKNSDYFMIIQNERFTKDIIVDYFFVNNENASLCGFSKICKEQIFKGNKNISKQDNVGINFEVLGMISKKEQIFGVSYEKEIALTTYEETELIADDLKKKGISNLSLTLTGWCNGGIANSYMGKVNIENSLGSDKSFNNLISHFNNSNVSIIPNVSLLETKSFKMFDGYSKSSNSIRLITKEKGKKAQYNPATFVLDDSFKMPIFLNNSKTIKSSAENVLKNINKYDVKYINLQNFGTELYSDFNEKNFEDRDCMIENLTGILKNISKEYSISTNGANAYALPYVSKCLDLPMSSNGYDITDESVPFLYMVLSGNLKYSLESINLSGSYKDSLLMSALVGADLSFTVAKNNTDVLSTTDYNNFYSVNYDSVKDEMISSILDYQDRLSDISGKEIIEYSALNNNVYKTVFSNGKVVVVNNSNYDFLYNGSVNVESKSFQVVSEVN